MRDALINRPEKVQADQEKAVAKFKTQQKQKETSKALTKCR